MNFKAKITKLDNTVVIQKINTDDELPPDGQDVLIQFEDGEVYIGHYNSALQQWFAGEDSYRKDWITHWAKIPILN